MKTSLGRFRAMAIICGINLLLLVVYVFAKHVYHLIGENSNYRWFAVFHGYFYIAYILTVLQFGVQKRMPLLTIAALVAAGTLPFASFIAERKIVKKYS